MGWPSGKAEAAIVPHPVAEWILAGEQVGVRREGDHVVGVGGLEACPRAGQPIDPRGLHGLVPISTERVRAEGVDRDQEDALVVVAADVAHRQGAPEEGARGHRGQSQSGQGPERAGSSVGAVIRAVPGARECLRLGPRPPAATHGVVVSNPSILAWGTHSPHGRAAARRHLGYSSHMWLPRGAALLSSVVVLGCAPKPGGPYPEAPVVLDLDRHPARRPPAALRLPGGIHARRSTRSAARVSCSRTSTATAR